MNDKISSLAQTGVIAAFLGVLLREQFKDSPKEDIDLLFDSLVNRIVSESRAQLMNQVEKGSPYEKEMLQELTKAGDLFESEAKNMADALKDMCFVSPSLSLIPNPEPINENL